MSHSPNRSEGNAPKANDPAQQFAAMARTGAPALAKAGVKMVRKKSGKVGKKSGKTTGKRRR
jgi:hypothetical protein